MTVRARCTCLAAPLALVVSLASTPARADITKDQCVDANSRGQELRRTGKLSAAREQFRACAVEACPDMVRTDCTKRLDELTQAQPTIAFVVKDASGADVIAVKVTVDGRPLADGLTGTALPVDPGQHVFAFQAAGQATATRTLVITEGEKGRREVVALIAAPPGPAQAPATAGQPDSSGTEATPGDGGVGTQKILGLVAGGVGVAGVAVGSIFGVMTLSLASAQKSDCASATSCSSHAQALNDRSSGMTDGTISTVAFIAGGALLVGGAVLFFTAGAPPGQPATAGLLFVPSVGPGGGGMTLRGAF
jgi:hypothetical protein